MSINLGRSIQNALQVQQSNPGGSAVIKLETGRRIHRLKASTTDFAYPASESGVAQTALVLTKAGTPTATTFKPTIANGKVTAVGTYGGTNTGWTVGDTYTYFSASGVGAVFTVSTVSSGAITASTVTSGGQIGPINPVSFFGNVNLNVNGGTLWDISATNLLRIRAWEGRPELFGILPLDFTKPWDRYLFNPELNALDLISESNATLKMSILSTANTPVFSVAEEFDLPIFDSNGKLAGNATIVKDATGKLVHSPQPVMLRTYSNVSLSAGKNDYSGLPVSHPIDAIYIIGSTPGNIGEVDVLNGTDRRVEVNSLAYASMLRDYDKRSGDTFTLPQSGGGWGQAVSATNQQSDGQLTGAPWLASMGIYPFDFVFKAAPDGRTRKSLQPAGVVTLRINSNIAQTCDIVLASFPGGYPTS